MKANIKSVPKYSVLVEITFKALKLLGGSGTNDEINEKGAELLNLPDDVLDILHTGSTSLSEFNYRMAWARTLLKKYGAIVNSARSVWAITPGFANIESVSGEAVDKQCHRSNSVVTVQPDVESTLEDEGIEIPEEVRSWRKKLHDVITNMDPYGFERLTQRLLRECGFTQVEVTKKSGDGGIDGTGKLKINGIFSFNIAFQCKRYQGVVGSGDIRDFRGSLTTNIEKGVFITTGSFSKSAVEEAAAPGKQQIDLIDGEEFVNKLAEFGIGVREVKDYEIDEEYFAKI